MTSLKRIALLLVIAVVFVCVLVFLATTFSDNRPAASANPKIRVLRRKDQAHVKPTKAELAAAKRQAKEERSLEDKIPKHLPIKVKIKVDKEKAFKDVDNPQWAHNLELEVTNTGTKPIYYLVLLVLLPEPEIREGRLLFSLTYGRNALSMFQDTLERAAPDDVAIKPGETYVFTIHEGQRRGFERFQSKLGWPNPKKLVVEHQEMSFGDGTGFRWVEGATWPPTNKKASRNECRQEPKNRGARAHHAQMKATKAAAETNSTGILANLLSGTSSLGLANSWKGKPEPAPDCCPSGCQWVKEYNSTTACYGIGCGSIHRADVVPCSGAGKCRKVEWDYQTCVVYDQGYDFEHECLFAKTSNCSSTTPTPTPPPPPPPPPPGSGLGGGSGNEGGVPYTCTDYYWYWFVSYDGGETWELSGLVDYAGCW